MIQPSRGDARPVYFELIAAGDLAELARGRHHAQVHREIGTRDLRFENFAQTLGPEIFRLKTVKVKSVLRLVKGMEERNALNVIPVVVGH